MQLKKPEPLSGLNIDTLCPVGQHVAVCLAVSDIMGVTRRKFQSLENEVKDVTRFVFGLIDQVGNPYLIQTYEFTISSGPNSNLMKFLTSWMGRTPEYGWDYCALQGTGAMISVNTKQSNSTPPRLYSVIQGIFPVPHQLLGSIPHPQVFAHLLAAASQPDQQPPAQQAYQPPVQQPVPQAYPPQPVQQPVPQAYPPQPVQQFASPQAMAQGHPPVAPVQDPQYLAWLAGQVAPLTAAPAIPAAPHPVQQQPAWDPSVQEDDIPF